jgi:hypothetical protein
MAKLFKFRSLLHRLLLSRWFPDRKALAAGLAGLLAFYITHILHVSPDVAMAIVSAISSVASYLVPPSTRDLVKSADLVITDVSGKVTDLMWKFDGNPKRKAIHVKTPIQQASTNQPTNLANSGNCACSNGGCGCSGTQDKPSV